MKALNSSKSGLYLVEFVIVLLFFSIASVVVFQLFVKGSVTSAQAYDINIAVMRDQSITEQVLATGGEDGQLARQFEKSPGGYVLYFDGKWNETTNHQGVYSAMISVSKKDSMLLSDVTMKKGTTELYSIHAERYLGLG